MVDLITWLVSEVGVPSVNYEQRSRMYSKLAKSYAKYGKSVLAIILECWEYSACHAKKRPRDEYFCWLAKKRLSEAGLWDDPRKYRSMDESELASHFKTTGPLPLFPEGERTANAKPCDSEPESTTHDFRQRLAEWARKKGLNDQGRKET